MSAHATFSSTKDPSVGHTKLLKKYREFDQNLKGEEYSVLEEQRYGDMVKCRFPQWRYYFGHRVWSPKFDESV